MVQLQGYPVPKYVHRHTLHADDANLHPRGSERAKMIRACFTLADLAHAGESRKKINPTIDYISHPIMAYDMLNELGETADGPLLGAAFLHDVLELDQYRDDPERLCRELVVELEKEGIRPTRAEALAKDIYGLVDEVTNPAVRMKNKELMQIDHVQDMSLRAKKLKIVDQCASFVCNLLLENDELKITYDDELEFREKGEALCLAILKSARANPEEHAAMVPYEAFVQRCLSQMNGMFVRPDQMHMLKRERMDTRHHFHFHELFTGPVKISGLLPDDDDTVEKLQLYDSDTLPDELESGKALGLLRIEYNAQGCVNKFYLHVTQEPGKEVEANRLQHEFTRELREKLHWSELHGSPGVVQQAALLPGQLSIDKNVRVYRPHPAMQADVFAVAAYNSGVCSEEDGEWIVKFGEDVRKQYATTPKTTIVPETVEKTVESQKDDRLARLLRRSTGDLPRER